MLTADWNIAENVDNVPAVLFACLTATNLHYGLFGELIEGPTLFLPSNKLKDCAIGTNYGRYRELMAGLFVTNDSTIIENVFDLEDKDDKEEGNDNDGEKNDDDWRKKDNGSIKDFDGRVKEEDSRKEYNDEESDEDHSRSSHLETLGKPSSLGSPEKPPPLDILRKLLDITEDTIVISDQSKLQDTTEDIVVILDEAKVPRLIATLASILITIVVDTSRRSGTSTPRNPTPKITSTISSIVKLFAISNDAADFINVLDNLFGNYNQNASPTDPAALANDFSTPFPTTFLA